MYYITTSRPYTNDKPHLGSLIDPIYGDVYSRFYKSINPGNVFFSMGTDEHSFKIADKAVELKMDVQEYVNGQYKIFDESFRSLSIQSDNFIQSSNKKHHFIANLIWDRLYKKDLIYKRDYNGLYCIGCEDFYSPSQLVNGKCPIHFNLEIKEISENNYFFRLGNFKNEILEYLKTVNINNKSVILEMTNFCQELKDISISRDKSRLAVKWGVEINMDPSHVMYVWFEALLTYLTPLIPDELYENWLEGDQDLKKTIELEIWDIFKEDLPQSLMIFGSDNSKFHLIIWTGMLLALGLSPIESIIVHGMINDSEGRKFAKSLGNGIKPEELLEKIGPNGIRFFILFYCNSGGDTNFDQNSLFEAYNSNLGNNLGNSIMRITTLIESHFDGFIDLEKGDYQSMSLDRRIIETPININLQNVFNFLTDLKPEFALRELFIELSKINLFLENEKPWKLGKIIKNGTEIDKSLIEKKLEKWEILEKKEHLEHILAHCANSILECNNVLAYFLPDVAERISEIINAEKITKSPVLFPKIEIE